jgi:hypothetical protein
VPSMSLLNTYREYSLKNPSWKPFGQSDLEGLQREFAVVRGATGQNAPKRSATEK